MDRAEFLILSMFLISGTNISSDMCCHSSGLLPKIDYKNLLLKPDFISGKMSTISFQYEERSELPIMNYTSSFIAHDSLHIFAGMLEWGNFNGA